MAEKPWGGRFSERTDRAVEAFTSSIAIDSRLYEHDIEGSVAHCRGLAKAGVISDDEAQTLEDGLRKIKKEIEHGQLEFSDSLEDIHMHVEARLMDLAGPVARKLHTGRSRNDQVALDTRMALRAETRAVIEGLFRLRTEIVEFAAAHTNTFMPGYTHLQRAQPVLLAHHFMAYFEMFTRDAQRFADGLVRTNVMPLGVAALAGTTYPLDREFVAGILEFPAVSANSIDTVSDRDFIAEFLSAASLCMVHFSRLSEEMILWSSAEFNFIQLPDAFATGSSIMPQKKNPDIPELVRGKSGRVIGALMAILTTMKSLPLSYNRDMQEDKPLLFDAIDTLKACIDIYTRMIPKISVNQSVMREAAGRGYLNATDLADYLVNNGVPFRKAHECVGKAVAYALDKGVELDQLSLSELEKFSTEINADVFDALSLEAVVNRRETAGGTATVRVVEAVETARRMLAREKSEQEG